MKKNFFIFIIFQLVFLNFSLIAITFPESYIILRDNMYNNVTTADNLIVFYDKAIIDVNKYFSDDERFIMLSRCEYIMGRAYSYEGIKDKAAFFFDKGIELAKNAIDLNETSDALLMYGENLSQNCSVKPFSYTLSEGTKIASLAKQSIKADKTNGAALYLLNAQYVYAPIPFNNYKKGISVMSEILQDHSITLYKDDLFNLKSAIGYGYYKLNNYNEAEKWFTEALSLYPSNSFVLNLQENIRNNVRIK